MKSGELGAWGERQAARYLIRQGYRMVTHNYRCRMGEIDLILEDGTYLIFAEVKLRKTDRYGRPAEYVTPAKRKKLRLAAQTYLLNHPTTLQPRFDVVEILAPDGTDTSPVPVHHIVNAF